MKSYLIASFALMLGVSVASAQYTLVSENFDSMGSAAGTSALPAGWTVGYLGSAGTQNEVVMSPYGANGQAITSLPVYSLAAAGVDFRTNYNGGTISDVGHIFNCGIVGAADRALGSYPRTNPSGDQIMQVAFTNTTGVKITSIQLAYDMEQWGLGGGASSSGPEEIRVLLSTTSGTAGFTYLGTAFDGVAPRQTASGLVVIDGNAAGNFVHVNGTYTLATPIEPGASMYLRFHDWNDVSTSDHVLAIDNVQVTATPEPMTLSLLALGAAALLRRKK